MIYFYKSCDKGSTKDIGLKRAAITLDSPLVPLCEKIYVYQREIVDFFLFINSSICYWC